MKREDINMSDTYVECLVKRKNRVIDTILSCIFLGLNIGFALIGFMGFSLMLFGALIFGFIYYIVHARGRIEFEYCYLDKEITVDRITNQARRKRIEKIDIERVEIMAPICSHHMDSYRNRPGKVVDYSTGIINQPDKRYMMFYDGGKKIIFEPNEEMVKAIRNVAPRKVFVD